jgi:hypothetical protein
MQRPPNARALLFPMCCFFLRCRLPEISTQYIVRMLKKKAFHVLYSCRYFAYSGIQNSQYDFNGCKIFCAAKLKHTNTININQHSPSTPFTAKTLHVPILCVLMLICSISSCFFSRLKVLQVQNMIL